MPQITTTAAARPVRTLELALRVPMHQPQQEYAALRTKIDAAMQSVAADGNYILGPATCQFEQAFAEYLGCRHAVGVGNGSDALYLTLLALGIGPGDEVLTTPFTFFATSEAIIRVGARPVFVDIDFSDFNLDVTMIEQAISAHTKAIIPVHLFGHPCNMTALMRIAKQYDLKVVEDCAQATGATYRDPATGRERKVGDLGDAGCFSFFPSKNLGTLGDGGMVSTNDPELYRRVEMLRRHGSTKKYHHEELGINSRLDEVQAAILNVKLPYLDQWNQRRRDIAQRYMDAFDTTNHITLPPKPSSTTTGTPSTKNVFHQFTVRITNRDAVQQRLKEAGIHTAIYYPRPLHVQHVHRDLGLKADDFPRANQAADECLSLPMHPHLEMANVDYVAGTLLDAASELCSSRAA